MRNETLGMIWAAVDANPSANSRAIISSLSRGIVDDMAAEWLERRRGMRRQQAKYAETQLPLPGFEALHAFYPTSDGTILKLENLTRTQCMWNVDRLRREASDWNVPRQRHHGAAKLREAEQLEKWACLQKEKRA